MENELRRLARRTGELLMQQRLVLVTAESCTGGWIAQAITAVEGSSQWFDRGFISYSNAAKREMLGVREATLDGYGAVSEQTVREMAEGALIQSHAQISVAVSGIAGPAGGSAEKPVGTVCLAWAAAGRVVVSRSEHFIGDRTAVRWQTVLCALQGIIDLLESENR
jgi:nicotinamide-nucleotide amidase